MFSFFILQMFLDEPLIVLYSLEQCQAPEYSRRQMHVRVRALASKDVRYFCGHLIRPDAAVQIKVCMRWEFPFPLLDLVVATVN